MMIDAELELDADPFRSFQTWYKAAGEVDPQPDAMALATVEKGGAPSLRMVLYRGLAGGGFRFFTNYGSRKSRELADNPRGALLFYWQPLRRQVRIEGQVERLSAAESAAYFATRDRGSQLGAWASRQSEAVASRAALLEAVQEFERRFGEGEVPCPDFWGGFRLLAERFEFWQHRDNRLHDRFQYEPERNGWSVTRLSP